MRTVRIAVLTVTLAISAVAAQYGGGASTVLKTVKVGGAGGFDYIKENSPTSFVVEQTVQTMPSAKTLTLETTTNHTLLIAAEYGAPATPPPAGGRDGRGPMVPDSFTLVMVGT
jgi:hypothetical protein